MPGRFGRAAAAPGGSARTTILPGRAQRAASVLGGVGRTTTVPGGSLRVTISPGQTQRAASVPGGLQRAAFVLGRVKWTTIPPGRVRGQQVCLVDPRGQRSRLAEPGGQHFRLVDLGGQHLCLPLSKISGCGVYFSRIENLENCNGKMPDRQSIEESTKIPMFGLTDGPTDRPHVDFPSHSRIRHGQTPTCLRSGALISSPRQGLSIIPAQGQCSPNTPAGRCSLPLLEEVLSVDNSIQVDATVKHKLYYIQVATCYSEAQTLLHSTTVKHKFVPSTTVKHKEQLRNNN